jgi:hypothetical protein
VVLPAQRFIERVRTGEMDDLKTIVAGYWLAERRRGPLALRLSRSDPQDVPFPDT